MELLPHTDAGVLQSSETLLRSERPHVTPPIPDVHPPVIEVRYPRRTGYEARRAVKRVIDVVVAGFLLVVASPVFLVIAVAVWATSPGSALFRHERVGRAGRTFKVLKFRSMVVDAEQRLHADASLLAKHRHHSFKLPVDQDPRLTPIGKVLRQNSLDELPQLWNVLCGHMSLVGPRPVVPDEIEMYRGHEAVYTDTRPGLTGLWQVRGRSTVDRPGRLQLDIEYAETWSLLLDLKILVLTVPAVLRRTGAH